MRKFIYNSTAAALFSGFLTAYAVSQENFVIAWICYVPLFISLTIMKTKPAFKAGLIFGVIISLVGFYWMIPGAERFTGSSIFYGVVVFIISACFFSLFFGLLTYLFAKLKFTESAKASPLLNGLLMATLFCIGEALIMYVAKGFPWFDFHSVYTLVTSLYAIQPAEYFGIHVITFVLIFVNYIFAAFIYSKQWLKLLFPMGTIAAYLLAGYFIFQNFSDNLKPGKAVNIALLSENIPPEMKWDDNTGNLLADRLLGMSRTAVTLKPDIALWTESAIPWTYKKDDDLVNTIIKITKPANITHILGINTDASQNTVYNSAYCLLPDGTVSGRYDKQVLLDLIEKPFAGMLIPFMSSNGFTAKSGENNMPLNTPFGKAGIMICNEAAVPGTAYQAANNGAGFICNMSNDGWFNNTYIVGLHFYNARLRAVETRKDVAVNSNDGYSGLIKASGEVAVKEGSQEAFVKVVTVNINHYNTLVAAQPFLFVYFCVALFLSLVAIRFF
jgi:apolipoprotein N-acyltransferase